MLRHLVAGAEVIGEESYHRCGVDYMAISVLGKHDGDECPDAVDNPPEVDTDDPFPIGQAGFPIEEPALTPALLNRRCTAPKVFTVSCASFST